MAKKINDTTSDTTRTHDLPAEPPQNPNPDEQMPASGPEKKAKGETPPQQIPEHAGQILKTFSNYPELYIDSQGGTFTVNTPPAFRSNATLYTNPYYTKP